MDSEDHDKDPNAVLQSLLSSENSKNMGFNKTIVAEQPESGVPIIHVYSEGTSVHSTTDGSSLQQAVDLESLQWQNLDRNGYPVGDTLMWEGTVQVDQLDNLQSLEVLGTTSDRDLKKTEIYTDVPVTITDSQQNPVLMLDSIPALSSTSSEANESYIPSTPIISIDSPPPDVPLPILDIESFSPPVKSPEPKKKRLSYKPSSKAGLKNSKKLKETKLKALCGKSGGTTTKPLPRGKSMCVNTINSTKKKVNPDQLNPTKLEDNPAQVRERFSLGCECQDANCFDGLSPDSVFRHKLNIAELTKAEHDMYLMGVTMACLGNPEQTNRNKERQRLRAKYVYQGRHVCLQSFLYLEHCTLYQLKRIRKHVITNGVVPRIHGNQGKKPHNRFPLELYCYVTDFLKSYLRPFNGDREVSKTTPLRPDVTRKCVHQAYLSFCESEHQEDKVMGYSTFRHFMKEQFPYIRFKPIDVPGLSKDTIKYVQQRNTESQNVPDQPHQRTTLSPKKSQRTQINRNNKPKQISSCSTLNEKDYDMILTESVVQDEVQNMEDADVDVVNDDQLSESQNVLLLNTSVPHMAGSNFVMVAADSFPQLKDIHPASPGGSGNKTMTINSSSLRLVSANGVSASSLVPMNTLAMLGPGVFPIYLDTEAHPEGLDVNEENKNEHIVIDIIRTSGNQDLNLQTQNKS